MCRTERLLQSPIDPSVSRCILDRILPQQPSPSSKTTRAQGCPSTETPGTCFTCPPRSCFVLLLDSTVNFTLFCLSAVVALVQLYTANEVMAEDGQATVLGN